MELHNGCTPVWQIHLTSSAALVHTIHNVRSVRIADTVSSNKHKVIHDPSVQNKLGIERVLANILRSHYVARTPALEARSPDCRSNAENVPCRRPITARNFENAPATC